MAGKHDAGAKGAKEGAAAGGGATAPAGRRISVLGREFAMPRSRRLRIAIGIGLIFLGTLGFLPVLGFWMIPLGVLVLSYEFASVRRLRRRFELWWAERRGRRRGRGRPRSDDDA